jgi:hypothetical protein
MKRKVLGPVARNPFRAKYSHQNCKKLRVCKNFTRGLFFKAVIELSLHCYDKLFESLKVILQCLVYFIFVKSRWCFLQIPDLEGNDYCLNLCKAAFASSKWLNCMERCTSHGEYNIIAYNTPSGIFLQTVRDVVPGQQLCVAYDREYGELSHFGGFS